MGIEELIAIYCECWGEADVARRQEMLERVLAEDASYTDPTVDLKSRAALSEHIGSVLEKRPGARIERTGAADAHHGLARFGWRVVLADGRRLPEGVDFIELAGDGRIGRIVGFFGPLV